MPEEAKETRAYHELIEHLKAKAGLGAKQNLFYRQLQAVRQLVHSAETELLMPPDLDSSMRAQVQ